jgi:CHAD domain-containing protein
MVGATPGVLATDTLAEAGRKVLGFHFERLLAREPGTREGRDIEELHQMRVATRRLRAAWRVFGDAFDPADAKRLKRPLRAVAAALGAVRDLDVLLEIARTYRGDLPEAEGVAFGALIRDLEARREAARQQLDDVLDQPRYGRWLHASVACLGRPRRPSRPSTTAEPRLVRELTPAAIWAAFGRVLAYEGIQRWADVPTLHALRIEGKRLRYSLEFVREALGPEVNPLIQRVTALQDHLGLLNDADVAATMARDFLATRSAELSAAERSAVGAFIGDRDRELRRLHRTAGRPWRSVSGILFRRRLGRVLAGL